MQFNDSVGGQGLIQDAEELTGLGATGISGSTANLKTFTRYINQHLHKAATIIGESMDDWDWDDSNRTDYPVATTPLVASQRDYTFPSSLKILKIKRVDVTYDGTNYYKCEPWDSSETGLGMGNDTTVDGRFSKTAPMYDVKANSVWLYPLPSAADVTASGKIRVEFYREPQEFTTASTTTEPGYDEPFHRLLSIGASLDYCILNRPDRVKVLSELYTDMEKRMRTYYGRKNEDRVWQLKPTYINYE